MSNLYLIVVTNVNEQQLIKGYVIAEDPISAYDRFMLYLNDDVFDDDTTHLKFNTVKMLASNDVTSVGQPLLSTNNNMYSTVIREFPSGIVFLRVAIDTDNNCSMVSRRYLPHNINKHLLFYRKPSKQISSGDVFKVWWPYSFINPSVPTQQTNWCLIRYPDVPDEQKLFLEKYGFTITNNGSTIECLSSSSVDFLNGCVFGFDHYCSEVPF